jgi:hypothetical protein
MFYELWCLMPLNPFRLKQDMKTQDHESIQRKQLWLCGDKDGENNLA